MLRFVFLRGRCVFWYFEPFTTRPVFGFLSVSPLFSFVWFVRRRRALSVLSLSLYLSSAGKHKPPSGFWGSPCVSSPWTSSSTSIRTSSPSHTPRLRPAPFFSPFFFLFVVVARLPARFFLVFVLSVLVYLVGVFLSLVLVVVWSLHCMIDLGTFGKGGETRHLPPL